MRGVRGRVTASGAQVCVITLDPAPMTIDEPFDRGFLPANILSFEEEKAGQELEVSFDKDTNDSPETLGETIDLGEIAAEAFGLALDPYPRATGAKIDVVTATPPNAKPIEDKDLKPFAALAALKAARDADDET